MKTKVKIKIEAWRGQTIILPGVGSIKVSADGFIEVEDKIAQMICIQAPHCYGMDSGPSVVPEVPEVPEVSEKKNWKIEFLKMNKQDLQDLAEEKGFPEEEWSKLTKKDLVDYLTQKMT